MIYSQVDVDFLETKYIRYTTSIFATKNSWDARQTMYEMDRQGKYSLQFEEDSAFEESYYELGINSLYTSPKMGFYEQYLNWRMPTDALIAGFATVITTGCIVFHTRSILLTFLGLVQIILAIPVSYFFYYFICRIPL